MTAYYIKNNRIVKLIMLMLFILTISSFAAIVSDNDGSSFVTKSEFDSIKNDFSMQIQKYNDYIDGRIDSAIEAYLADVRLFNVEDQTSIINTINSTCNDSYKSGTNTIRYGYRCMAKSWTVPTTQKPEGAITNMFTGNIIGAENSSGRAGAGFARIGLTFDSRTGLYDVSIPSSNRKNGKYVMLNTYNNKYYPTNVYSDITYRYYVTGSGAAATFDGWPTQGSTNSGVTWNFPEFRITETEYWKINVDSASAYWNAATSHTWDTIRIFYGGTYENNESINVVPNTGSITNSNIYGLLTENLTRMRIQDNYYDWETFGRNQFNSQRKNGSSWITDLNLGYDNKPTLRFYFNCHPYDNAVKPSEFIDYYATKAYGDGDVSIYGGLPVFKATNNGVVTIKLTFKSVSNNDVVVGLSTSQFANDGTYTIQSDLNLRKENDEKYTSNRFKSNQEYTFKLDIAKDQVLWIKTYDASSDTGFTGVQTQSIKLTTE